MCPKKIQRQSIAEIAFPASSKCYLTITLLLLVGCSQTSLPQNQQLTAELQSTYDRSCKSCHEIPASGAPQTGNTAQWIPRYGQGIESLLVYTIDGKGNMPPMGQCFECSREQLKQMILFMASEQGDTSVEQE